MISTVFKQMIRRPLLPAVVLCFTAILAAALCGLHATNVAEQKNFEEIYRTVPVTLTVTNLTGERSTNLEAERWVHSQFTCSYDLGDYITDVNVKMSQNIHTMQINGEYGHCKELVGITSLESDVDLLQGGDQVIVWKDGYDASILRSGDMVCIVPEGVVSEAEKPPKYVDLRIKSHLNLLNPYYDCKLKIVGTHSLDSNVIYCPFSVVGTAKDRVHAMWLIDSISGTLADNYKLDEMWSEASDWFVKPNPKGEKTPWDYSWYTYYPYALVVDDSQLVAASEALENSIKINRQSTLAVFAISVVTSFFVGFLAVRQRKRDIALMRTIGTGNGRIFLRFLFELMLCAVLGTALGGAFFLWTPIKRLLIFVCIYFVGLSIALLIFLHTNLLSTMREDE